MEVSPLGNFFFIRVHMLTDYTNTTLLQGPSRNNGSGKKVMIGLESTSNELGDEEDLELPFLSFRDVVSATNNFSDGNMLGRGGFGKVYKVTTMKFLQNTCIFIFFV